MANYLVTGGAGFIGCNLVIELLKRGDKVRVLDNYSGGKNIERIRSGAEYFEGDIRSKDDLRKAMEGIDGIFHMAALPRVTYSVEHPEETHDHNVNGTLNVLLVAKEMGVKRVVFSTSSSMYGADRGLVSFKEDMALMPISPYALHKMTGYHYCRLFSELYGLKTVSLCYFNVYGPLLDPDGAYALVVGRFLKQRKEGVPLTICGDGEYFRDYTHVSDIVSANILAMEKETVGNGELINIGNGEPHSVNELAKLIGGETVFVPPRPGDMRYTKADNSKAKILLGWVPTIKFEDGIRMMKDEWKLV